MSPVFAAGTSRLYVPCILQALSTPGVGNWKSGMASASCDLGQVPSLVWLVLFPQLLRGNVQCHVQGALIKGTSRGDGEGCPTPPNPHSVDPNTKLPSEWNG